MEVARPTLQPSPSYASIDEQASPQPGHASLDQFEIGAFQSYLDRLLPVVAGAQSDELADSIFSGTDFVDKATRFGTDPACMVVYVNKIRGAPGDVNDSDPTFSYTLSTEMTYAPNQASTVAFIKRVPTLDTLRPLDHQLHFLNLFGPASSDKRVAVGTEGAPTSGTNPYEELHSLVSLVVAPFFDAYVNSKGNRRALQEGSKAKDADSKMGIPMTKKKLAELELSLLHLQQNVEIPDISLSIHPIVKAAVDRCRNEGIRLSPDVIDHTLLSDDAFLNKIQAEVNSWVKEIQNVTKLSRDVGSGTASQEINFWLSMEKALEGIEDQLKSDPITLTLDILKHAKRFHATVSFIADTGLKKATDDVHKYNQLMKDFPLDELLAATDLEKIQDSLFQIFGHITKKLRISPYPIRRALPLVEAISRDFADALLKVLGSHQLMYMEYASFERTMAAAAAAFTTWDEQIKDFTNVAREVTRRRSEKFIAIKINPAHGTLKERCEYLRQFRKQHEQLRVMTGRDKGISAMGATVKASGISDIDMEDEVRAAYESVKNVDVLDTSVGGTEIWVTAETAYNETVARVENQIIARLRDRLARARNANEMFRVFSKFNALFIRPKIRGAVQEYQTQLIDSVKEDIRRLHEKFKTQYRYSEAYHMSQLRDLPPISGAIIWAKQIERQLFTFMKRVEDVLGKGWELYAEGQKLQTESNSFRRKLETQPIYEAWLHEINRRDMQITGRIFEITRNRSTGVYQLIVAFDPQIIVIFKEVRNLLWLGFSVPHSISSIAKDAKRVYPYAVSLMESVRTYTQTAAKVDATPGIAMLVAEYRAEAQQMISKGMALRWENFVSIYADPRGAPGLGGSLVDMREGRPGAYVREFASVVSIFQDRTDALIDMYDEILRVIDELGKCEFKSEAFTGLLARIQKTMDRLNLEGYANLPQWVDELDKRIEAVFLQRLGAVIAAWTNEFRRKEEQAQVDRDTGRSVVRALDAVPEKVVESSLRVPILTHEVRIKNQVIYLDPPIETARERWYQKLHEWLGVICHLPRIRSERYEIGLSVEAEQPERATYAGLLSRFSESRLQLPYSLVEDKLRDISSYVGKWLQFQALWDLEAEAVYAQLGDSLAAWQQLLSEIRKTRTTFDNSESSRHFGVAVVQYEQVQAKVNAKYDGWQRDILLRFGSKLGVSMRETHAAISKARRDLEQQSIETLATGQAVDLITFVSELKAKVKKWTPEVDLFGSGQKTLERQRFPFPSDWLYVDQVESEWTAFNDILGRKNSAIQEQLAGLQLKIVAEDKVTRGKIQTIVEDWDREKPIQGSLKSETAMNSITAFEGRVHRLKEEYDRLCRAKEALDLEHTSDDRLDPVIEEIRDLKAVWTALSGIWAQIAELRDTPWSSVTPRKLRQSLEGLLGGTREMPSRMRQYAAFEFVQDSIRQYQKSVSIVAELKSDAMRERHWRLLYRNLRLAGHYSPSQMTLGTVWDMDLKKNEGPIREVLVQASGEVALEEYIKQIKETWTGYTLDLVNYQNKTRLIRGWDELFAKCGEHINALSQMKLSPYFKTFEEDALVWEDKLNRVHVLFDVWIDVQRQWVYLEGIFSGSADIKHLLPLETSRFQTINSEFMAVMKKVFKSPFVLDVLNIPAVLKSFERLAELLGKIQKALGEYLERERASFPRFYFVGDEDLLEIIGNSKDVLRIVKHLKKMFAGVSTLLFDHDVLQIEGMASREGEEIRFSAPIVLKDFPKINDWLAKLESEMRTSLALTLAAAVDDLDRIYGLRHTLDRDAFLAWTEQYPAQVVVLGVQVAWTRWVDQVLKESASGPAALEPVLNAVLEVLDLLADVVLGDLAPIMRRKCEHLITELVHQRDVIRQLQRDGVGAADDFHWLGHMRFYLDPLNSDPVGRMTVHMADAVFPYGFEYLGVQDRLVQTPLTDRCYLTLTQALHGRLGGSPFGPAGTGKTESVKALGNSLGRFVLVFCCDETFDFQAMGRIFVGLCQVGAWGCFDEANRLEERILSAVSQQIQSIQQGLKAAISDANAEVELVGRTLRVNPHTGIFITMNPGYAGRSNLPDNLKKLFRSMAMTKPDRELIAQVMLFSQGFRSAEVLAYKIVPFFSLCDEQLSRQPHYDFGLRALKAVLVSAGHLKRGRLAAGKAGPDVSVGPTEQEILVQSVTETIVPKLVAEDVHLLKSLLSDVFPGIQYFASDLAALRTHVHDIAVERHLTVDPTWLAKVIQLYQIQEIQHGLMMVGPSATGKTQAWQVLLAALERLEGREGVAYVIDPKAIPKDALYGTLDSTTREWTDGLFTHILRKIVDNVRGEDAKRHWIIFDGDVDPEWVENLNSVLDDNKLLTLPNGERLNLPSNVRIMFEVESLRFATLATVSRCGMVWFSEDTISASMLFDHYLGSMRHVLLGAADDEMALGELPARSAADLSSARTLSPALRIQRGIVDSLAPHFARDGIIPKALDFAGGVDHIMDFTQIRAATTLFSLINRTIRNVLDYQAQHPDFPLPAEQIDAYSTKRLVVGTVWAFTGDSRLETRARMGDFLRDHSGIDLPPLGPGTSLIDYDVQVSSGDWVPWQNSVPVVELDTHAVTAPDVVVPTVDTIRHEDVLYSWLAEHKPLMLCGPPGSGKTMTLFSALRKLPDLEVVGLNFSSATTPELVLKTFDQYCEFRRTPNGVILAPVQIGKWLVVFCDEINLPAADKYGTQRVISFLRQLVECGGFWRPSDKAWIKLERIQFVGACNPPTDPGRVPLSHRFLRHAPLVMVDYPGEASLRQIYGTFVRAALKVVPSLRGHSEPLTSAMVDFYLASQQRFTPDIQAHYIYSPRELTRWVRGIFESIRPLDGLSLEGLVRVWAHEALRLFSDRLVADDEKKWTDERIDEIALSNFPTVDRAEALARPILFSNWTSKHYISVERESLREYTKARLRIFYEEELDVPLVLFNDVLDHVLRIDRVFRQTQGHVLLIGVSGSGKTTLSRFVAWMNGLSVFQIKVHNKYSADDFDEDLRSVLRRAGCKGEKVCFIMDESNVLDSGFLERMNTLLANAEVPGLFEGDDHAALMTACKEGAQRDGVMLNTPEELYRWFTSQVAKNLHVVFTMNPPESGLATRAATSPALFNRCVLDWLGDWSDQAFYQVGMEFTSTLDLDLPTYSAPSPFPIVYQELSMPPTHRAAVVNALVAVHASMYETNRRLARRQGRSNYATPRHYLDLIAHYVRLFTEKRDELEDQQRHLNVGLDKLRTTVVQVEELRASLAEKRAQLQTKNAQANDKLRQMVGDQQEAEQKKQASIQIQGALEKQKKDIAERRAVVMRDLADAEPAVLDAQASVSNIKKQHLTEVRAMANPPEAVKLAMESVCTALGHRIDSWKTVQGIIRRDDFISSIVNFDTEKRMTRAVREKMRADFLSRPGFNFEAVNRASKACGPLCKWVIAQVNYSDILDRVGPLRNEVQALEDQAGHTAEQASTIVTMIAELEASIARYKDEYAALISETQAIKTEMDRVQRKVDRSITLLDSLGSERARWQAGSSTFEAQMSTVAGDILLSAAQMAYGGFFDQAYRASMWRLWADHLGEAGIRSKPELSLADYLSTADDRLGWQSRSLPADDLCTENAVMLKRFNRYPLIIDPTGQATRFLVNEFQDRKMAVTSFLDEAFVKNLESALRFGTPLLIQDAEHLDPILNPVLNREVRRAGGRVLIRLGSQDIDFSPAFTMFLSTRDPTVEFSPDICSRVTFVNFTMTRTSLQSQSLAHVLRVERPDTDRKRTDLMKLQGEFRLRLRHLERALLQALSESSGNILDDDKVIDTLETLKTEAAEVAKKVEETDVVMEEIEQVTAQYQPLAHASSSIYFVLEQLAVLHHFYQFSLRFFNEIFEYVLLRNPRLKTVRDPQERLSILLQDMFAHTFRRTSRALLHQDHLSLAVSLAQIKIRHLLSDSDDDELAFLLAGGSGGAVKASGAAAGVLNKEQAERLETFSRLPCFKPVADHVTEHASEWRQFLSSPDAELSLPTVWSDISSVTASIRRLLLIKCFRPDRLLAGLTLFANDVFGLDLLAESSYSLANIVEDELAATTPLCLCSIPGYDASYRVDQVVDATGARCAAVAMGSREGFALADQAIANGARTGTWVLLKNVHLSAAWLGQLEKKLQTLNPHRSFRLFLTMETNPSIPVSILRQACIIMNEPPPGIKANLLETLKGIPPARFSAGPAEKARLYFLLAWLHAVVQERLRYCPLGWSKFYEFNDSDLEAALSMIDSWVAASAKGKANIDPLALPWQALRDLIKQAIYGGRVDSEWDQRVLDSFVDLYFTPSAFEVGFKLVDGGADGASLSITEGSRHEHFLAWAKGLPEREPPEWLSLPARAEALLATAQGASVLTRLVKMRSTDEDESVVDSHSTRSVASQQPAWMRVLRASAFDFLASLPKTFEGGMASPTTGEGDSLRAFFAREVAVGKALFDDVRRDLQDLIKVCDGAIKQTNDLRSLIGEVNQGAIPARWRRYRVHPGMSLADWISNLGRRLAQLARTDLRPKVGVDFGLLFFPDGYLTATRQAISHLTQTSLEELKPRLELEVTSAPDDGVVLTGMAVEGADIVGGSVALNDGATTNMGPVALRWVSDAAPSARRVDIPCYLDSSRSHVLFTASLPSDERSGAVARRGIAVRAA